MDKKIGVLYTVFSILVFVALGAWSAYSLATAKANNVMQASLRFNDLSHGLAALYLRDHRFDAESYQNFTRSLFLQDPAIEAMLVESTGGEVQLVFARHAAYVEATSHQPATWTGSIRYNSITAHLFTGPLPVPPSEPQFEVRAVFTVLGPDAVYPVVRRLLLALIGFVILTGIVIAVFPLFGRRTAVRKAPRPAAVSADPPPRQAAAPEPAAAHADRGSYRSEAPPELAPEAPVLTVGVPDTVDSAPLSAAQARPAGSPVTAPPPAPPAEEDFDLPEGIELPSLEEVLGEHHDVGLPTEITLYEELEEFGAHDAGASDGHQSTPSPIGFFDDADEVARSQEHSEAPPELGRQARVETIHADIPDLEVTDIEPPGAVEERGGRRQIRSATEELADLPNTEDLEELDGSRRAETIRSVQEVESLVKRAQPAEAAGSMDEESVADIEPLEEIEEIDAEIEPFEATPPIPPPAPAQLRAGRAPASSKNFDPAPDTGARQGLFNPETGLAWQEHFEQRLTFELERSASFDQDLVLAVIRCRGAADGSVVRRDLARQISSFFPFGDLCFEHGADSFGVVIPNTDIDQSIRSLESFRHQVNEEAPAVPRLSVGITARNGRLLSGARMIQEADRAAARALSDPKNSIYALRVDPGKYRQYIKSTLK